MNNVQKDKCFAHRLREAGCGIGIIHATDRWLSLLPASNIQRIAQWRDRSGQHGIGNSYFKFSWRNYDSRNPVV